MSKPRLLDLFCGAGGAARGYADAGFEIVGVDIQKQPNYPYPMSVRDALQVAEFYSVDAIHASPPCQAYTAYRRSGKVKEYPDLIEPTREYLDEIGKPYVIENVEGSPLEDPVLICATMFDPVPPIQRHRLFETNWDLQPPTWPCRHKMNGKDNFPGGRSVDRTGHSRGLVRATMEIGSWDIPLKDQQEAMGIDWMTLEELSEAIPPAYTEFIGRQLLDILEK
jgi:DNA (cytosine-5)-methyltransferase 1